MSTGRRLLSRLRELIAHGAAGPGVLPDLVRAVAAELVAEVCSVYLVRPGEILELVATHGLNPEAVGRTRLRVGEGIVGTVAAQGLALNLPDAQNHPAFAYRPETGEEPFASLLAVPIRRAGAAVGVVAVQNLAPRLYDGDEVEVLETVAMLLASLLPPGAIADGFNASLSRRFGGQVLVPGVVVGTVALSGVAAGPVRLIADNPVAEFARLDTAVDSMRRSLDALIALRAPQAGESREVLEAHRLIAGDRGWLARVRDSVRGGFTAEAAVDRVVSELRGRARRIADPYLRERLADVEDVANRLLGALCGTEDGPLPEGAVLVARRLGPAELLGFHARGVCGLVLEEGSAAGHAAIIARTLGLPVLGGVRGVVGAAQAGDAIVLDADEARVILRPESEVRAIYQRAIAARGERRDELAALLAQPATTVDGTRVRVMLNAGLATDLDQLDPLGADGVGLFRTEIAALARGALPDAAEQRALYGRVLEASGGREVVFRTFDLGGDKMLPGFDAEADGEENPAMGWRALRIALDRPAILRGQVRALLQAAAGTRLSVMFPMVTTVAEFAAAKDLLLREAARLGVEGTVSAGAMLEVPALWMQRDALCAAADFVCIGSNDLTQFMFAADRGSPRVGGRYDLLSAPMLDLLEGLVDSAAAAGIPLSICGEQAGRPIEAMAMLAIGIRTLSMSPPAVPRVRQMLAALDLAALRPALAGFRAAGRDGASLRDALTTWARHRDLPL